MCVCVSICFAVLYCDYLLFARVLATFRVSTGHQRIALAATSAAALRFSCAVVYTLEWRLMVGRPVRRSIGWFGVVWRVLLGWGLYVRARCDVDRHGRSYEAAPPPPLLPLVVGPVDDGVFAAVVVIFFAFAVVALVAVVAVVVVVPVVLAVAGSLDSYVPTRTSSMTRHQSSA